MTAAVSLTSVNEAHLGTLPAFDTCGSGSKNINISNYLQQPRHLQQLLQPATSVNEALRIIYNSCI